MLTQFVVPITFTVYGLDTQQEVAEEAQKLLEGIRTKVQTKFIIAVSGTPVRITGSDPAGL